MRHITHFLILSSALIATVGAMQPVGALGLPTSDNPMTADEKREQTRLSKAKGVSLRRESAVRRFAYAEKCEAAFEAGEPMPEVDFYIKENIGIDDDLMDMTFDEILEESARASDDEWSSDKAWKACAVKYRKRNSGS